MTIPQEFTLSRLDQVRALADPLRLRLVEALVARELPVAGLAKALDAPATRLYHHVDLLHEAELIEITRRVKRRGGEERYYRAVARQYRLDDSLLSFASTDGRSTEELERLARTVLGSALEELTEGLRKGQVEGKPGQSLLLENREMRLSAKGRAALAKELPAWLDDFARRYASPRGGAYRLALAAFPARRADATGASPRQARKSRTRRAPRRR
jgi:DNA-binding transcriptional ArsR family regulator